MAKSLNYIQSRYALFLKEIARKEIDIELLRRKLASDPNFIPE